MKLIDLQLNIDGLILSDEDSVDDLIRKLQGAIKSNTNYNITYQVLYEEDIST